MSRALIVAQALLLLVAAFGLSRDPAAPSARPLEVSRTSALPAVPAPAVPAAKPQVKPKPKPLAKPKPKPVAKPKPEATVKPRPKATAKPKATLTPRVPSSPTPKAPVVSSGTAEQRMMAAVARIPGASSAHWFLVAKDGYWGTADWYHNAIYISPAVPANRIYDVVAHEWAHLLSVQVYGIDVPAATAAMNRWYGGTGVQGPEKAADCMAKELGAVWTHYTPCADARWRQGGAKLLAGQRL
jgi:hypothetical protein